jgi:hypothetical protein
MSTRAKKIGVGVLMILGFHDPKGTDANGWTYDVKRQILHWLHVYT